MSDEPRTSRLAVRLKRNDPVRIISEDLDTGKQPRSIRPLFAAIIATGTRHRRRKRVAVQALGRIVPSPEEESAIQYALMGVLDNAPKLQLPGVLLKAVGIWTVVTITLLVMQSSPSIYVPLEHLDKMPPDASPFLVLWAYFCVFWFSGPGDLHGITGLIFMLSLGVGWSVLSTRGAQSLAIESAKALAHRPHAASVEALVGPALARNRGVRRAARETLISCLARVDASAEGEFTTSTWTQLSRLLASASEPLGAAIVRAMGVAGPKECATAVRKWMTSLDANQHQTTIQEALESIDRRASANERKAILLRPSDSPAAESTNLLRPAVSEAGQLLRPANHEDEHAQDHVSASG